MVANVIEESDVSPPPKSTLNSRFKRCNFIACYKICNYFGILSFILKKVRMSNKSALQR